MSGRWRGHRSVSDCVEMYQNGQDENMTFFWHQICCGFRRGDSQPLAIARDTKKTDKKAKFLSGCPRKKSPIFTLPVFMQFQVTADRPGRGRCRGTGWQDVRLAPLWSDTGGSVYHGRAHRRRAAVDHEQKSLRVPPGGAERDPTAEIPDTAASAR